MRQKIITINGQKWQITKPDHIGDEMAIREIAGHHVSIWARMHAKYIGKRLNDGKEYWLPWNYRQFISEISMRQTLEEIYNLLEKAQEEAYNSWDINHLQTIKLIINEMINELNSEEK